MDDIYTLSKSSAPPLQFKETLSIDTVTAFGIYNQSKFIIGTKLGNLIIMDSQMSKIEEFITIQSKSGQVENAECIVFSNERCLIGTSLGRVLELVLIQGLKELHDSK